MRRPTSDDDLLAWWVSAISCDYAVRKNQFLLDLGLYPDQLPECGWFYTQYTKGGPKIPVRITISRDVCAETGELLGPEEYMVEMEGRVFPAKKSRLKLYPISIRSFEILLGLQGHNPEIMAATKVAVNILDMRFLPPRR